MIDVDNFKKDRNICKNCYNINRKNFNKNEKKRKNDGSMTNRKNQKSVLLATKLMFQNM